MSSDAWLVVVIIAILALFIGIVTGLGWALAGPKADRYNELTGKNITRSDVFWCGEFLAIRPDEIVTE